MSRFSRYAVLLAVVAVTLLAGSHATPVRADGIAVQSVQAQNAFPQGIVMTVTASSNVKITSARLRFQILPEGPISSGKVECTGDAIVNCKSTVGGGGYSGLPGAYIVPFAEVKYHWEITDSSGQTLNTDEASIIYRDTRFQWKTLEDGNLTVFYYSGDEATMHSILAAGRETIDKMGKLEGTTIPFQVKVIDYATVRDLQPAIGNSRNPNSVVLGEVGSTDTALETRQTLGAQSGNPLDTVRHELTHVVTNHATKGNPAGVDSWINEGISMFAQVNVESDYTDSLKLAIKSDKVFSISELKSTVKRDNDPGLFYGQALSVIKYLVTKYGDEKFTLFVTSLNSMTTDDALGKAFGLDQVKLENDWRQSVGLAALTPTAGGTSGGTVREIPTLTPFGSGSSSSGGKATPAPGAGAATSGSGSGSSGGGGSSAPLIAGVVIAVVVLGGGGLLVLKRKGKSQA